jgi:four helix bundle protein
MKKEIFDQNPILKLTYDFSVMIVEYTEGQESLRKFNMANQLFRSGTSIGANAMEAQNAESKADFVHKIKIAAKEAEETQYWLWICSDSKSYPSCHPLMEKAEEINKVLGSILHTTKKKNPLSFFIGSFFFFLSNLASTQVVLNQSN